MKIAQIAPLQESVPPKLYGGTERVVHCLTEALTDKGHEVTLFASGDSDTKACLVPCCDRALRLNPDSPNSLARQVLMIERVFRAAEQFDILHFHIDYIHFPLLRRLARPSLTTFHWRLDLPEFEPLAEEFTEVPVSSVSYSQRSALPGMNWAGTVHHGLDETTFEYSAKNEGYLAFLGRLSPEKGPLEAIEIAKRTGLRLKIAAKINDFEQDYFETEIEPHLAHPLIEYVGEICEEEKSEFLGGAHALLFPIKWPEPFGLVMIEALACGTPVVAFRNGSVPEVLRNGITGYIVRDVDQAVEAVKAAADLDRSLCRKEFEKRFTASAMADTYLMIYRKLILKTLTAQEESTWKKSSRSQVSITSSQLPH